MEKEKFVVCTFEDLYHLKNCVHYLMIMTGRRELEDLHRRLVDACVQYQDDVPVSLVYPEAVRKILADLVAEPGGSGDNST